MYIDQRGANGHRTFSKHLCSNKNISPGAAFHFIIHGLDLVNQFLRKIQRQNSCSEKDFEKTPRTFQRFNRLSHEWSRDVHIEGDMQMKGHTHGGDMHTDGTYTPKGYTHGGDIYMKGHKHGGTGTCT